MSLFDVENPASGERFDVLARCRNVIVERIASSGVIDGTGYDQPQDEWVALLRGEASLDLDGAMRELAAGDHVFIPAHRPHRVITCSADAVWLAVHVHERAPAASYEIREGSLDDVATICARVDELEPLDEATITTRIDGRPHLALIAVADGEPAGFKLGYRETPDRFYSWIGGVVPAHRKRGVARQLLDAQERWCLESGYRELVVKSRNRFRNMIALLVGSGYDIFAVQMNGAIVFRKQLDRTSGFAR